MNELDRKLIVLIAGGTGGHVYPAISTFHFLKKKFDICIITDKRGCGYFNELKKEISSKGKHKLLIINSISPFNRNLLKKIKFFLISVFSFFKIFFIFIKIRPSLLIGYGGYTSVIPCLAGKLLGTKYLIHEQNGVMGRANKFLERFCSLSLIAFKNTTPKPTKPIKRIFSGIPLREGFVFNKNNFHSKTKSLNVLIFGGSLGSDFLSTEIPKALCRLDKSLKKKLNITHQVTSSKIFHVKNDYQSNNISSKVDSFFSDIFKYYMKADLIICRAGGTTLAEIISSKIPSIIIPLENSLDDHQKINSKIISKNKVGWVINQKDFKFAKFNLILKKLIFDKNTIKSIKNNFLILEKKNNSLLKNNSPNDVILNSICFTLNQEIFKKRVLNDK